VNLDFDTLVIDEFKSFTAGKQIIRLTQDTPGVTFVQGRNEAEPSLGPNGAAKSSIIDAIMWCLYGRTVKSLKNPDVIPWVIGGSPYVSLVLYINNRRRKVSRQAKPNKLLLDGEEASGNAL
jgi:chromosome segregation ATPase